MMRALYSATGIAITPLLKRYLKKRQRRGKEDAQRLPERFGHASIARPEGTLIWLHAASVGEAQSVLTLMRALTAKYPTAHLLITTGTVTSAALVAQQAVPRVIHQYMPIDTLPSVRRFFAHWQPDMALWVESEFWPQLVFEARTRRIPMLLINARLSERSFERWQRWPRTIARILGGFDTVFAGSHDDATRLSTLGATNVRDAGNLKFDAAALPTDPALLQELQQTIGTRPCWLAASTHGNEEHMIANAHTTIAATHTGLLTLLVPRHAARGDTIATELRALGLNVAQRSKGEPITTETHLYLADTMGELGSFYRAAPMAFLGGSLIAHGGHNPLEPARLDCAVISGTHTHNFAAIVDQLRAENGIAIVADTAALAAQVSLFLREPQRARAQAQAAAECVRRAHGASTEILARIEALLERAA